ncbi:MAG: type II toxin-antitoxin system VapC family toxin [Bauldia sp.]|nr:type II toxin-antitoxin system VapC family toxin [Bauldia sp.]MCW5718320.1 type II toxin-antitoxin system VapC family toxin [Bauldia sp.]
MIALDTSALVAIALEEPDHEPLLLAATTIASVVGAPTLVEVRLVLESKIADANGFIAALLEVSTVRIVPFTMEMYSAAAIAFERYGKGRGHPAQLNFGDCMAYAVAKTHGVPLLYKGDDFALTDIRSALK